MSAVGLGTEDQRFSSQLLNALRNLKCLGRSDVLRPLDLTPCFSDCVTVSIYMLDYRCPKPSTSENDTMGPTVYTRHACDERRS